MSEWVDPGKEYGAVHDHDWEALPNGDVVPGGGTFVLTTTLTFPGRFEWCPICTEVRNR